MTMYKRKVEETVDAFRWEGGSITEPEWAVKAHDSGELYFTSGELRIKKSNTIIKVERGDYIARNERGKIYSLNGHVFEKIFSKVKKDGD